MPSVGTLFNIATELGPVIDDFLAIWVLLNPHADTRVAVRES